MKSPFPIILRLPKLRKLLISRLCVHKLKTQKPLTLILIFLGTVAYLTFYQFNTLQSKQRPAPLLISLFDPLKCSKCSPNSSNDRSDPRKWIPNEPFVYLKVFDGLGNQMFQFACAFALAKNNSIPLLIYKPRSFTTGDLGVPNSRLKHGEFGLHLFQIPLPDYNSNHVKLVSDYITSSAKKSQGNILRDVSLLEENYTISKQIIQIGDYCQSEMFFGPYKDEILEYFKPKESLLESPKILKWMEQINYYNGASSSSVSVHVRRGDLKALQNRVVNSSFYFEAMEEIRQRLREIGQAPKFFIFSDKIAEVRKDFQRLLPLKVFKDLRWVSYFEETLLDDLYLMSQCRHNILSTSTFGWWGAYMNKFSEKIVIASHYSNSAFPGDQFKRFEYRNIYYPNEWFVKEAKLD